MTKEMIIIALICALFYLYQQNRQLKDNSPAVQPIPAIAQLKTSHDQLKQKYHQQAKLLAEEQLANNQLTEQINQLESKVAELTKSDWATNRLAELEQNLRTKEAQIQDLEKQVRRLKKK